MTAPAESWSTQQLVEFLAVVSASADARSAQQTALDRAAEALEADVGAIVQDGDVLVATGFPDGRAPVVELIAAAGCAEATLALPWGDECACVAVPVETSPPARLLLGRTGEAFGRDEISLLRGMARVLALSRRSLDLLDESEKRRALLERLGDIQRAIVRRAGRPQILEAIVAGAHELLDREPVTLHVTAPDDPSRATFDAGVVDAPDEPVTAQLTADIHENGRTVGSLVVSSRTPGRVFGPEHRDTIVAFAEHASLALTDARNFDEAMRRARYDALTGLANRAVFLDRLERALARNRRSGQRAAVLFLDLDNFKAVNDSLGHPAGDELLEQVAVRLRDCIRDSDTAARFGGDEFAVLLEDASGNDAGEAVAARILASFDRPFRLAAGEVRVGASIGIVEGDDDPEELLRDADLAMYRAKTRGRQRYEVFEDGMREAAIARAALSNALRGAVDRGELRLHFQPIVELADEQIAGFEALVRWQHPELGLVPPLEFIPLAEDTGQIVAIGRWVLRTACAQAASWRASGDIGIAVNLSAHQLQDASLVGDVAAALRDSGLPPGSLTLEITESILMVDTEDTIETLHELKALGVRLAIDDFGTGYSSLQYLRRFPVDILKIAKPFVDGLAEAGGDSALPRAITYLARSFGLDVVAEGIEESLQQETLATLGCRLGQGFLFSRPVEAAVAAGLLPGTQKARDVAGLLGPA